MPHGNGLRRMINVGHIGRATHFGAIKLSEIQAHIFGLIQRAKARHVTSAIVGVDIVFRQTCVFQCTLGDLGMELGYGFTRSLAQRVFVNPRNKGLSSNTHSSLLIFNRYFLGALSFN